MGAVASVLIALTTIPSGYTWPITGRTPPVIVYKDLTVTGTDGFYGIMAGGGTNLSVLISLSQDNNKISHVGIMNNEQDFDLMDVDQDGFIDNWCYGNRETEFAYFFEKPDGYPCKVQGGDNELVSVRVNGTDYLVQEVGSNCFVEVDGDLVEIEKLNNFRYVIKNSEPGK